MKKIAKKILIGLSILLAIPVVFFAVIVAICLVVTLLFNLVYPSPDIPVIKEAEFPFRIVYEDNGTLIEIEDTYVCRYEGVYTTAGGKYRSWDEYFKSGNENALVVFEDDTTEVGISIGSSRYYMGDPLYSKENGEMTPTPYKVIREDGGITGVPFSDEDLYSEYGIRIISWELSKPIENTFVPKKWYEFWK